MDESAVNWFWQMQRGDVPAPPVADLLGQRIVRVDLQAGELDADFVAAPTFLNPAGGVQGGMLGAMLDALAAGLVDATVCAGEGVASLNLNISFLRPAKPGRIAGRARLIHRGRSVVHAAAELEQDGKMIATATAVCTVVQLRRGVVG